MFKKNDCTEMGDRLPVYNVAVVALFIEVYAEMAEQYCLDKIDICKDAVIIPGI